VLNHSPSITISVLIDYLRQVKVSYLVVGHTHEDVDACIGTVVTYLRTLDIPTFSKFREECMAAIRQEGGTVIDVERVIGMPDYDNMFQNFGNLPGI